MSNDIKRIFEETDWPPMPGGLRPRILNAAETPDFAPWMILKTPIARFALAFSFAACLAAGFFADLTHTHHTRRADMAMTGAALAYYLQT